MNSIIGVASLAASLVAFGSLWVSMRTLRITELSVRQSVRPVLVPDTTSMNVVYRGGRISEAAAGPALHKGQLIVPIRNVGAGPAMNIRAGAETVGGGKVFGEGWTKSPIEGLGIGESNAVVFSPHANDLRPLDELVLSVVYEDVAGARFATDLHYENAVVVRIKVRDGMFNGTSPLSSDGLNELLEGDPCDR
jgi:hypothetical protein